MHRFIMDDDRGAATTDWVALTAGIVVLGIVVAYSVLGDSHQHLLNTFDALNIEIENNPVDLAALGQSIDLNK